MTASAFALVFACALLVSIAVRLWLATRQIRHVARHRDAVPEAFADRITLSAHRRAADYTVARVRLGIVDALVGALLLLGFTLFGGLQWLLQTLAPWLPDAPFARQMLFVAAVATIGALVDLPIAWYRHFRLEQRFGFNRMTPRLFVTDALKGAALAAVLGLPLLALVLWLMRSAGALWWLWAWLAWVVFNLAVLVLYPTVIAPMFNRFEPLPDGAVRERVEALLARCGFASKGLFVMDGSRRSAHGNAYFTGLGRAKRIVFFDTLLSRLDPDEIEAVLAHELGHFRHRHITKRIALAFVASLAGLWLLGWLSRQGWFYQGLGVTPGAGEFDAAALVLFFLVLPVFTFLLQPLSSWASRRHEYQADAFAAAHARARDLVSALVKLYEDNASTLTPDPLHSAFYDSHPPASLRIGRLHGMPGGGRDDRIGHAAA
ncbi:MAG: M48 family metallopeptidase [Burkholderiaceae bacterium]|nr:M48 family metallopeptidase [Burkholderiaceae bacterium]